MSILALAEQSHGLLDEAEEHCKRAELEISKLSLDYFNNLHLVGAYYYVGIYYCGAGGLEDAAKVSYLANQVEYYCSTLKEMDLYQENLSKMKFRLDICNPKFDVIGCYNMILSMFNIFEKQQGDRLKDIIDLQKWESIKRGNVTPENYLSIMQIIEIVHTSTTTKRYKALNEMEDCRSDLFFKVDNLFFSLICEGMKFVFLSRIQGVPTIDSLIEEAALNVTIMTENDFLQ